MSDPSPPAFARLAAFPGWEGALQRQGQTRFRSSTGMTVIVEQDTSAHFTTVELALRRSLEDESAAEFGATWLLISQILGSIPSCYTSGSRNPVAGLAERGVALRREVQGQVARLVATLPSVQLPAFLSALGQGLTCYRSVSGLKRARAAVGRELMPGHLGDEELARLLLAVPDSASVWPPIPPDLAHLTPASLNAFQRRTLVGSNLVLGVAGPHSLAEVALHVGSCFTHLRPGRVTSGRVNGGCALAARSRGSRLPLRKDGCALVMRSAQGPAGVLLALSAPRSRQTDPLALLLAHHVLGGSFASRLVRALRSEHGLAYATHASLDFHDRGEQLTLWAAPRSEDVGATMAVMLDVVGRFAAEGPSPAELKRAKHVLALQQRGVGETASERLREHVDLDVWNLGSGASDGLAARLISVSAEAVRAAVAARTGRYWVVVDTEDASGRAWFEARQQRELCTAWSIGAKDGRLFKGIP